MAEVSFSPWALLDQEEFCHEDIPCSYSKQPTALPTPASGLPSQAKKGAVHSFSACFRSCTSFHPWPLFRTTVLYFLSKRCHHPYQVPKTPKDAYISFAVPSQLNFAYSIKFTYFGKQTICLTYAKNTHINTDNIAPTKVPCT